MKKKGKRNKLISLHFAISMILIVTFAVYFYNLVFLSNTGNSNALNLQHKKAAPPPLSEETVHSTSMPVSTNIKEQEAAEAIAPIYDLPATTIIETKRLDKEKMNSYFYQAKISDDIYNRIYKKSYKKDCTVPLSNLRFIKVLYYGFDKETHVGELIVNAKIADTVLSIFKELYEANYPIEKIQLVDEYDADDERSMSDNNTSCFNYRVIDGTSKLSKHSLGLAIDINPLYNPYVRQGMGDRSVLPVNGAAYADRSLDCPYYISKDDLCYKIFLKYGFTWGGSWTSSKDYQHFEISID